MIPGLVSTTFRTLPVDDIIALSRQAGLSCIEWSGDGHLPPGDTALARDISTKMRAAGLAASSYGSYYRAGEPGGPSFQPVLETALALGCKKIRIWAGCQNAEDAEGNLWQLIVKDIQKATSMAVHAGLEVVLEFHANTLTNSAASARRLLEELHPTGTGLVWQPMSRLSPEENLTNLSMLAPWVRHVHCFYSAPPGYQRSPLELGQAVWSRYLRPLSQLPAAREILLEFVRNATPAQFLADAKTLRELLRKNTRLNS